MASSYINRTLFFDVHPPLGKVILLYLCILESLAFELFDQDLDIWIFLDLDIWIFFC